VGVGLLILRQIISNTTLAMNKACRRTINTCRALGKAAILLSAACAALVLRPFVSASESTAHRLTAPQIYPPQRF
jgi:hypothetical protein